MPVVFGTAELAICERAKLQPGDEMAICDPRCFPLRRLLPSLHPLVARTGNKSAGQTLLVLGAGGGVGVAACQIGLAIGAKVVAVVQGSAKADFLRRMGVEAVVDSSALVPGQQLHKAIKALAPKGEFTRGLGP